MQMNEMYDEMLFDPSSHQSVNIPRRISLFKLI